MILKTRNMILVAVSLFLFAGCASSPKTAATTSTPMTVSWEYREIKGFGAERSPEAAKLKQEGWTFMGLCQGGGVEAEDNGLVTWLPDGTFAIFRREYK
jgi:hypothetical protein